MPRPVRLALLVPALIAFLAVPTSAAAAPSPPGSTEWVEVFSPDGTIRQVEIPKREAPATARAAVAATVTALQQTGASSQRFDLVFVGDGYTSSEISTFQSHAASKWAEMTTVEPFKTYKNSFNVWMVNVVSTQSGVDNDPTQGISRNTTLGMGFWCSGIERLLCVNTTTAKSYAALAPGSDQVVALANSTKYGGAGYGAGGGVATASGGNASSGQVAIHELGHSMGNLADEYSTVNSTYTGGEPSAANASKYTAAQLTSGRRKWYRYLGQATPDGGVIGAYQGAADYAYGIYRPSENSIMRTLGRQFNLVGLDAMTKAILAKTG
ncbi:M64 family metallopeptidase [Streptosporangium sp. NPDC049248]|uniref:M64 family metallopeptidase n=1 Tax=Streptosporangium sp. NPDC049248 TaxID=3155651 RepID=UPI00343406C8